MATIHRATLLSFDPATWTALVLIDGADAEAQMPVSQWLPPAVLVANVECAVVLFDPTNTDDGLLIGVYGSVGNWTLPALNLGTGTSAAPGSLVSADSAQARAPIILAGQEFFQAAHTDTNGLALLVGVNRSTNRQLWIADSALLAQNNTNPVCRIEISTGKVLIGGIATDGATVLPLSIDASALDLINGSVLKVAGTQVLGARKTGWAAATNTKSRATFDTTTVTLPNLAARLGALLDDLISHGVIGP